MEDSNIKAKSLNFVISKFGYSMDFFHDEFAKNKSMLIEAEHLDTKRVWKLLIEERGLCASSHGGKNKIMLGPETIFKAFEVALRSQELNDSYDLNKINTQGFSVEFPFNGKDENSPLIIVIDIENQFSELYQQCPITLEPVEMTNEELHQKQIEHLRKTVSKLEKDIKKYKKTTNDEMNDEIDLTKEVYVTRKEFEELRNKIKGVLQNKVSKEDFQNYTEKNDLEKVSKNEFYSTLEKKVSKDDLKKIVDNKVSKQELKQELNKKVSVDDFDIQITELKSNVE